MALYTRAQFADLCGKKRGHVTTYVTRGKLIVENDMIDDEHPVNKLQKEKWLSKMSAPVAVAIDELSTPDESSEVIKRRPSNKGAELTDLEKEKKRAEIAKIKSATAKTELQTAKLRGESVPTDYVKNIISVLGHSLQSSYKNGAEILLLEFAQKAKLAPEVESEMKGRLIDLVNKSQRAAIIEAKKALSALVEESSGGAEQSELNFDEEE